MFGQFYKIYGKINHIEERVNKKYIEISKMNHFSSKKKLKE